MKNLLKMPVIDIAFLIAYLVCILYFLIEAITGGLLPLKYILIVGLVFLVILMLIVSSIATNKAVLFRRVFIGLICVLTLVGALFQGRIRDAFNQVNTGNENVDSMNVVVLAANSVSDLSQMENGVLGIKNESSDMQTKILEDLNSYKMHYEQYPSVKDMMHALDSQKVDAILLSQRDYSSLLNANSDFSDTYKLIKNIEYRSSSSETANEKDITSEPFTVYITGMDVTGLPDHNALSDVNMIVMVDPAKHNVTLVSIPRDAYVPNLNYYNKPDKLTHLGWQGSDGMVQAVENVFGFDIDYYARVSFSSLIEIVNTLGGIDVDVQLEFIEQNEYRELSGGTFINTIHLYPRMQTLNGSQALAYARHRHTEGWGDFGRNLAQRQIIEAIVNKLLSVEGISKVSDVLNVGAQYVATNMPMNKVKQLINKELDKITPWTFNSISMLNGIGAGNHSCASAEYEALWVYLLSQRDIDVVYDAYLSMFEGKTMSDFKFDMNDLAKYTTKAPDSKYLVTAENYYEKMSVYFPDYLAFTEAENNKPLEEENPQDQPEDNPSENPEENPGDNPEENPEQPPTEEPPTGEENPPSNPEDVVPESPIEDQ